MMTINDHALSVVFSQTPFAMQPSDRRFRFEVRQREIQLKAFQALLLSLLLFSSNFSHEGVLLALELLVLAFVNFNVRL